MSYLRGRFYTWSDGLEMNLPERMPEPVFDALVAMRWAEMTVRERAASEWRAIRMGRGNVGCQAVCEKWGVDGFDELFGAAVARLEMEEAAL